MSQDLATYSTMKALNYSPTTEDKYYSKSDAAEAEQIAIMQGQHPGVGDTLYTEDEQAVGYLHEIGLDALTALADKDS